MGRSRVPPVTATERCGGWGGGRDLVLAGMVRMHALEHQVMATGALIKFHWKFPNI